MFLLYVDQPKVILVDNIKYFWLRIYSQNIPKWTLSWMIYVFIKYFSDFYKERKKHEDERKKALSNLAKKSPKGLHQTNEQRNYQLKVKEMRSKSRAGSGSGNESTSGGEHQGIEKDRQPRVSNLTSDYDLKLFMEAQAIASEKIVSIFPIFEIYMCENWWKFNDWILDQQRNGFHDYKIRFLSVFVTLLLLHDLSKQAEKYSLSIEK